MYKLTLQIVAGQTLPALSLSPPPPPPLPLYRRRLRVGRHGLLPAPALVPTRPAGSPSSTSPTWPEARFAAGATAAPVVVHVISLWTVGLRSGRCIHNYILRSGQTRQVLPCMQARGADRRPLATADRRPAGMHSVPAGVALRLPVAVPGTARRRAAG
jgi:hypothetical protein